MQKKTEELAEDEEKLRVVNEEIEKHRVSRLTCGLTGGSADVQLKIDKLAEDITALEGEVNDEMAARAPLERQKKDAKNALAKAQGEVAAMEVGVAGFPANN